jgi:hypothetical protein
MSDTPPSSNVGRYTALVLGFVVFLCVVMIGGTGYLKYRLDRAETALATFDNAPTDSQNPFNRLRQEWGYSGFLGLAQKYVFTREQSALEEMKARIKSADAIVASLPDSTPAAARQELASVASLFDAAMQKIESGVLSSEAIAADLAPLYSAVAVLDAQKASANAQARAEAHNQAQFWATLLTLVSWFSLVIAAGCTTGIYLVLRDKRSAPMRALAQSIQNMAHGDMRTAIWGIERQDMIGELARAIDIARYHFSHLPDVSLMSESGPVRLRFEGGSRSLFEAMMKTFSTDTESIREQASTLTEVAKQQNEAITSLSGKVEAILRDIEQRGQNGDKQIAMAIRDMVGGAENLKNAHAHTADQLARLVPTIQDRAQGLAEITQITGKQLTHTLQSLASSEIGLKANTEQAKETLAKLSATADGLSERLFGAINLLQASGKVLGETTDAIKSQWNDVVPQNSAEKMDLISEQLDGLQKKLDAQADSQFGLARALEETSHHNDATSDAMRETVLGTLNDQLLQITERLAGLQEQIDRKIDAAFTQDAAQPVLDTTELSAMGEKISQLAERMAGLQEQIERKIDTAFAQDAAAQPALDTSELSAIGEKISQLAELDGRVAVFVSALPGDLRQALREEIQALPGSQSVEDLQHRLDDLRTILEETRGDFRQSLREEFQLLPNATGELQARLDELRAAIDATNGGFGEMLQREIQALPNVDKIEELQQRINALHSVLAVSPHYAKMIQEIGAELNARIDGQRALIENKLAALETLARPEEDRQTDGLPEEVQKQFMDQWYQMSAQIEASRTSMVEALSEGVKELGVRLAAQPPMVQTKSASDYALQIQIEKQTEILTELVSTLGILDAHMQEIKAQKCA